MQNEQTPENHGSDKGEYKRFAAKRVVAGILIAALIIWMASVIFGFFEKKPGAHTARVNPSEKIQTIGHAADSSSSTHESVRQPAAKKDAHAANGNQAVGRYKELFDRHVNAQGKQPAAEHGQKKAASGHEGAGAAPQAHVASATSGHGSDELAPKQAVTPAGTEAHPVPSAPAPHGAAPAADTHAAAEHGDETLPAVPKARGVAFVQALIRPLDHELNKRFWGWRPNDILNVTDNINNFQLGVLEVTRRTTIVLTERISRIGSAASFDDNMEQAMNWFMIKPSTYWLPSPEDKYGEGLDNLRQYARGLETGMARFYTRTDSLIPLLSVYQDLLGSCDENLVKTKEDTGKNVSSFKADDYFYYAKGVASALMGILEAVQIDFNAVIETSKARDALHHAVESLHHAVEIDPWIILNSNLSSIFANHRANMAAPISHARFYLGVAIGALST